MWPVFTKITTTGPFLFIYLFFGKSELTLPIFTLSMPSCEDSYSTFCPFFFLKINCVSLSFGRLLDGQKKKTRILPQGSLRTLFDLSESLTFGEPSPFDSDFSCFYPLNFPLLSCRASQKAAVTCQAGHSNTDIVLLIVLSCSSSFAFLLYVYRKLSSQLRLINHKSAFVLKYSYLLYFPTGPRFGHHSVFKLSIVY